VLIERVTLASDNSNEECMVHQALAVRGRCVAPGFGASDCTERCPAHLWLVTGRGGSGPAPERGWRARPPAGLLPSKKDRLVLFR
jgi:hypothetical protein